MNGYYVCRGEDYKPVDGPYMFASQAAKIVMAQADPAQFCTMSRYALAKIGAYPNTKAGNSKLKMDLISARSKR